MAYLVYKYTEKDTMSSIASYCGIPVSELAKINNIPNPITNTLMDKNLNGYIKIPDIYNGQESFENRDRSMAYEPEVTQLSRGTSRFSSGLTNKIGFASDNKCYIAIGSGNAQRTYYFPCFPEKFTDSRQANYTSQNPLGRSEPFQIYQNSGPRTVQVAFRMHREMLNDNVLGDKVNHIDTLVYAVQSATYPLDYGAHIPPRVTLVLGNACTITGIIEGSVSADWSETIIDDRYQVVDLSFSVTEVTGNPITYNMTNRIYGYGYNP